MADGNEGTTTTGTEAQPNGNTDNVVAETGTPNLNSEVTTLRSRNAGLDAKVTALMQQVAAAEAARQAAEARLGEYEAGKAGESEAARAQIERLTEQLAATQKVAQVNALKATYPESYSVYGDAIAGMSEDVLAAGEARLAGVAAESNITPTPIGNNAPRTPAPAVKSIEEMSLEELKAHGAQAFNGLTWEAITVAE